MNNYNNITDFGLNLNFTREEDELLRSKEMPANGFNLEPLAQYHSLRVMRFRYLLSLSRIENLAKLYLLAPKRLKKRILLHLNLENGEKIIALTKTERLLDFGQSHDEVSQFLMLLSFELLLS